MFRTLYVRWFKKINTKVAKLSEHEFVPFCGKHLADEISITLSHAGV